jgi:hypothetical protein
MNPHSSLYFRRSTCLHSPPLLGYPRLRSFSCKLIPLCSSLVAALSFVLADGKRVVRAESFLTEAGGLASAADGVTEHLQSV